MTLRVRLLRRERIAAAARVYRHFGPEVRREWRRLALALLALLGAIAAELAKPWPIKILFDSVLLPDPRGRALLPEPLRTLGPATLLDEGRLVREGKHEELLRSCPLYGSLVRAARRAGVATSPERS